MNSIAKKTPKSSNHPVLYTDLWDTRFGIDRGFDIAFDAEKKCLYLTPEPSSEQLNELYEKHYNFHAPESVDAKSEKLYQSFREKLFRGPFYRLWLKLDGDISFHLKKGQGKLLDVGCNEGRGLVYYKAGGFEAEGLELNSNAAKEAQKKGFRVYTQHLEEFEPTQLYDVVVLSNVLEHVPHPEHFLEHVHRILNPNGVVCISCPNANSWQRILFARHWVNWHIPFHLTHFFPQGLKELLTRTHFKTLSLKSKTPSLWLASSLAVLLFAKRGQATKELRKAFFLAPIMLISRFLFFPIHLLANAFLRGDCLVVEAQKIILAPEKK